MENFLLNLCHYGLFQTKLIDENYELPKEYFGAFITVTRRNKIHGCMGNWQRNFSSILPEAIFSIAHDACWNDQRKKKNILQDSSAEFSLSLMTSPKKYTKTGKIFDNSNQGLLLMSDKNRATFLPKVFGFIRESEIIEELEKKAGVYENYKLYSYKTKVNTIFTGYLMGQKSSYFLIKNFCHAIWNQYNAYDNFPYIVAELDWPQQAIILQTLKIIAKKFPELVSDIQLSVIDTSIKVIVKDPQMDVISLARLAPFIGKKHILENLIKHRNEPEVKVGLAFIGINSETFTFKEDDSIENIYLSIAYNTILRKNIDAELFDVLIKKIKLDDSSKNLSLAFEAMSYGSYLSFIVFAELIRRNFEDEGKKNYEAWTHFIKGLLIN